MSLHIWGAYDIACGVQLIRIESGNKVTNPQAAVFHACLRKVWKKVGLALATVCNVRNQSWSSIEQGED